MPESISESERAALIANVIPATPMSIADMQLILMRAGIPDRFKMSRQDMIFNIYGGPNRINSNLIWY